MDCCTPYINATSRFKRHVYRRQSINSTVTNSWQGDRSDLKRIFGHIEGESEAIGRSERRKLNTNLFMADA